MKLLRVAIPSDLLDVDDHFHFHQFPKPEQQAYSSVQSDYLTGLRVLQTGFDRSSPFQYSRDAPLSALAQRTAGQHPSAKPCEYHLDDDPVRGGQCRGWNLGALLQGLLWTQNALAGYYVCCDIALLWQAYTKCHTNGVRIERHPLAHGNIVPSTTNGTLAASENTPFLRGATEPGASTITNASAISISRRPTRNRPLVHSP
ncbi:hypothetical protein A4X06_0g4459 [Tilletia controversa]|uniref:Uncharacterized protein n=2 Tax=Tilletia TaxID=13289 RepID=A0A8X7SWU8_9BASI|nr:hypothetical protein CF328_g9137 [Tilletia controversa]KAE8247435.1 hypothetical protein A4X06_0g4459 [Tilletia controversa]CAD6914857.1 unnamed protein product [Tilletia caries]CAD7068188.1 unnamed protein product [Tilletia caries]